MYIGINQMNRYRRDEVRKKTYQSPVKQEIQQNNRLPQIETVGNSLEKTKTSLTA